MINALWELFSLTLLWSTVLEKGEVRDKEAHNLSVRSSEKIGAKFIKHDPVLTVILKEDFFFLALSIITNFP